MQYGYKIGSDKNIILTSGTQIFSKDKKISDWTKLSEEDYNKYLDGIKKDQILYLDENDRLQLRDKLTKWDAKKKKWITDIDAVNEQTKQQLIAKAKQQLILTDDWGLDDRCADSPIEKVTVMREYRKQLRAIIRDELDILPDLG